MTFIQSYLINAYLGESTNTIARSLNMTRPQLMMKISRLRKQGIAIPTVEEIKKHRQEILGQ